MPNPIDIHALVEAYAKAYAERDREFPRTTQQAFVKAEEELNAAIATMQRYEQAFDLWSSKTEWARHTPWTTQFLGLHMADALHGRIRDLESQLENK